MSLLYSNIYQFFCVNAVREVATEPNTPPPTYPSPSPVICPTSSQSEFSLLSITLPLIM